ncbi:hypothetical protein [Hymenobacter baengnokdamensis]|uniref:hypothetical protein n=1 Tax=Hymenobacter baengnokdamensis TaxID=2615203 RepID=UPI0017804730|nr:hypothetical protein [Hymenobacter baengnokdamensis]
MKPQPVYFDLDDKALLNSFQQELDKIDEQHRQADQRKKNDAARKVTDDLKRYDSEKAA